MKAGDDVKRIIILCDGTWSAAESLHPTNVVRLAQALAPTGADGICQVPIYVEGVGTGRRGVTPFARWQDRILGGLMGLGLMENVAEAYRHLVFLHEPGDEVFVFGFSRGAFTARTLAGFVRFTGLLARADLSLLPRALERYATRGRAGPEARQRANAEWRAVRSPHVMTDPADRDVYGEFGATSAIPFDIAYLGVWDTVGALGVPGLFTEAPLVRRRHAFHDTALTPMVRAARHAVAIDERRRPFAPTLWSNLEALNAGREDRPYRQEWFPGDHGAVGGGGEDVAFASPSLLWLMEGARAQGLVFDPLVAAAIAGAGDPLAAPDRLIQSGSGGFSAFLRRIGRDRGPVRRARDVSDAARDRWRAEGLEGGRYRPPPLAGLRESVGRLRGVSGSCDCP